MDSALPCSLLALALVLVIASSLAAPTHAGKGVPAIYVFGDSTADVGNNNYLSKTTAKANYPHYGIDFPGKRATGRFSNCYNGVDVLAYHMGFRRSPPPYLSLTPATSHSILRGYRGINFASAGSGILDSTGIAIITLSKQIKYFEMFRWNLTETIKAEEASKLLAESVFLISSGGNDVFAFFSQNPTANKINGAKFIDTLVSSYEGHIKSLYNLGARKFALIDIAPVGCTPFARRQTPSADCILPLNDMALAFNKALHDLLQNLASTLRGMKYSIGSSYTVLSSIIANPKGVGYREVKAACCGTGTLNAATLCILNSTYCDNRSEYLFWDLLHPTHATAKKVAYALHFGSLKYAAPINFKQLVEAY